MIQVSYCCAVGIGQKEQAQCNRLAFSVLTQGPPVLANHSLEEKAEGL